MTAINAPLRPRLFFSAIFKTRGLLMVPLILTMALNTRWECEVESICVGVGLPLFFAGWAIRIWSQRHLKYRLRLPVPELATTGPYQLMRNPVYVGNTLLLVAICFLCELFWFAPFVLVWSALVYHLAVVGFEEVRLRKMFGEDYIRYMRRVPRWIPNGAAFERANPHAIGSMSAALAAEWHCGLLLAIPLLKELVVDTPLLQSVF